MNKKMLVVAGILLSVSSVHGAELLLKHKQKSSSKKNIQDKKDDKKNDKAKVPSLDLKKSDGSPKRSKISNGLSSGGTPKVSLNSVSALESYVKEGRTKTSITRQSGEDSSAKK